MKTRVLGDLTISAVGLGCMGMSEFYGPRNDAEALATLRRALDHGDDLLPERSYPQGVDFEPAPERQLAFDRALLGAALERRTPVLAICYGMQLLALAAGGALHYDVSTDVPEAGPHRLPERDGRHPLHIATGTRLAAILGEDAGPVNSLHHQAVARPGEGARVCGVAGDGLIEAIELEGETFAIGVQWHPEKLDGPHRERLFAAFAAACGAPGRMDPAAK